MDMTGDRRIPAPRDKVWAALNDPAVLKLCIPGCDRLEREADDSLVASASIKIGPISARFNGRVQLLDLDPPNGYRIAGEGQGGVAGFAKGGATVHLVEEAAAVTMMSYTVSAQVGGKIAQLGARLIDATAKQMADAFFTRFAAELTVPPESPPTEDFAAMSTAAPITILPPSRSQAAMPKPSILDMIPQEPMGFPRVAWIGCGLFAIIFIVIFKSYL